jgi:hypothetical protein
VEKFDKRSRKTHKTAPSRERKRSDFWILKLQTCFYMIEIFCFLATEADIQSNSSEVFEIVHMKETVYKKEL